MRSIFLGHISGNSIAAEPDVVKWGSKVFLSWLFDSVACFWFNFGASYAQMLNAVQ
jgi:hypothetical protein